MLYKKTIIQATVLMASCLTLFVHTELPLTHTKGLAEPFRKSPEEAVARPDIDQGPATAAAVTQEISRTIDTQDTIFSPIYGMLAWHSPYLINLWQNDKESATARLVQQLFNLQFDGVTFDVSGIPGNTISHLSCYDLGYIVGLLYNYEQAISIYQQQVADNTRQLTAIKAQQETAFPQAEQSRTSSPIITEQDAISPRSGKDVKKSPRPISPFEQKQREFAKYKNEELLRIKRELAETITEYLETLDPLLIKHNIIAYYTSQIAHASADITREQDTTKRHDLERKKHELENKLAVEQASPDIVLRAYHEGKRAFVNDIVSSMLDTRYLPHNTILLLLACMWKKANNYEDILPYIYGIYTAINNKNILFNDDINRMLQTSARFSTYKDYSTFRSILMPIIKQSPYTAADHQRIIYNTLPHELCVHLADYAFAFVGFDIFGDTTTLLPSEVTMNMRTKYGETIFPDCGETSILNFFAAILYNPTTKQWNIDLLNTIHADARLKKFFMTFAPDSLNTQNAHDAWATVVSNRQQVNYIRPTKCEINTGADNMLKVIAALIPDANTFPKLEEILTQNGVEISFDTSFITANTGTLLINLIKKNQPLPLHWLFVKGHFHLKFPSKTVIKDPRINLLNQTPCNALLQALLIHYQPIDSPQTRINNYYQAFLYNIQNPFDLLLSIQIIARLPENVPFKKSLLQSLYETLSHQNNPLHDQLMYLQNFWDIIKQNNIKADDIDITQGTSIQKQIYINSILLHESMTEIDIEKIKNIIETVHDERDKVLIINSMLYENRQTLFSEGLHHPIVTMAKELSQAIIQITLTIQNENEKASIISSIISYRNLNTPLIQLLNQAIIPIIPTIQAENNKVHIINAIIRYPSTSLYQAIIPIIPTIQAENNKLRIVNDILIYESTPLYQVIIPIIPTIQDNTHKKKIIKTILDKDPTRPGIRALQESIKPLILTVM